MGEAGNRGQRGMLLEYRKEGLTQTKPAVEGKTGDGDQAGKKQKRPPLLRHRARLGKQCPCGSGGQRQQHQTRQADQTRQGPEEATRFRRKQGGHQAPSRLGLDNCWCPRWCRIGVTAIRRPSPASLCPVSGTQVISHRRPKAILKRSVRRPPMLMGPLTESVRVSGCEDKGLTWR